MTTTWNFLTNHGRALLCIADNPDVRIRDIAANLGITERRTHGIVSDLTVAPPLEQSERSSDLMQNGVCACNRTKMPKRPNALDAGRRDS